MLIGTVDKNDGIRARDIDPSEGGVEPEAKGPEHRKRQNSCQDLHGRKEKHNVNDSQLHQTNCFATLIHKMIPEVCIQLYYLEYSHPGAGKLVQFDKVFAK